MGEASRYKRVALLGEGGMAQVFLTLSEELGASKLAVVKQLRPELAGDEQHRAMFLDEARLAVRLHHPNIVQTFEVGERNGTYFMAMEYLEGQPLNQVLQRAGREQFPAELHLHVVLESLRGLAYAHELTDFDGKPLLVVHRDVSPHNVFLTYDGQVKVVDFGIAKAMSSKEHTKTGVFKGKPTYASPEQALGEAVDQRADVYSVGVMLWEAIARRRMWGDKSETAVLVDLVNGQRPKLLDVAPDAPPELAAICEKALQQAPEDRYATSRAFLDALEGYVVAQPTKVTAKDLGARVSELFWSEHERIRSTIEEQVRLPEAARTIRVPAESSGAAMPLTLLQLAGITPLGTESGHRPKPSEPARSSRALGFGGVAAAVFLVAITWGATRLSAKADGKESPSAKTAAASQPSVARAAPLPSTIKIQVRTDPEGASILLDGQPFDPATSLARDSSRHHLTISAPGFETRTVDVAFTEDQSLAVVLRPAPAALPSAKGASPRAARAGGASVRKPASAAADAIDEVSPYRR